jgi:serine/threonine protein kinase
MQFVTSGLEKKRKKNVNVKLKNEKPELKDYIINENPEDIFSNLQFIDEGCFGQVFKGIYTKTKQTVAIKTIRMQGSKFKLEEVVGEIAIMDELQHENITKYIGFFSKVILKVHMKTKIKMKFG